MSKESDRACQRRRVQIHLAGATHHLGYAPTPEAAQLLREKIKQEAPNARRERPS